MVIGSKNLTTLYRHLGNLEEYSISLIPRLFSNNREIINNQKYFVALGVRNLSFLDYNTRVDLCNKLLEDIYLTGSLDEFIEIAELYDFVDFNRLLYNLLL